MSAYQQLFKFDGKKKFVPTKKKVQKASERGCEHCPLDKAKGINKVKNLDKVIGRKIMLWAQNPGREENEARLELVGDSGKFLWEHAEAVGLRRKDCDIQNVVRCWTATRNDLNQTVVHNPTPEELHACSIYSEEAIKRNNGKAKVHIVLGQVAAKALLRGEYRKGQNTFFSKRLNAWVICTYHPAYFLRGAPRTKLVEFRQALKTAVEKAGMKRGKFAYLDTQDYESVAGLQLYSLEKEIREGTANGNRLTVDIEDGYDEVGNNVIVYVGFSWKKGHARGVFLLHKSLKKNKEVLLAKVSFLKRILEDKTIKKAFHHGVYDVWKLWRHLAIHVRGFDHDTTFSEYLRFSWARAYGLAAIADRRFRQFAGYKGILEEFADKKTKLVNFFEIPRRIIILYNGADCDLTKRIEHSNDRRVNYRLLQVMIKVANPIARMEENGPLFDFEHSKVLDAWIPKKVDLLRAKIQEMAKNKKLNPNAPAEVAKVIYDKMKLGKHLDETWIKDHKRSTGKETMQLLGKYHEFPTLVVEYRKMHKKKGTYLDGFRKSAEKWNGRLRTKWWLTGTITCRLRSGGEKNKKAGIVNLQNIHGDPAIENLIVSDVNWKKLYGEWKSGRRQG